MNYYIIEGSLRNTTPIITDFKGVADPGIGIFLRN